MFCYKAVVCILQQDNSKLGILLQGGSKLGNLSQGGCRRSGGAAGSRTQGGAGFVWIFFALQNLEIKITESIGLTSDIQAFWLPFSMPDHETKIVL